MLYPFAASTIPFVGNEARPKNLEQVLDRLSAAAEAGESIRLKDVMKAIGRRSFGPLLLVAGLVMLAPIIGDIPGVPTIMASFVVLIAVQLLFCRDHFWLPHWLLNQSIQRDKFCKALKWMRPPARFVDRFLHLRLEWFTGRVGVFVMAITCIGIAAATPLMEFIPFSANGAGAAITGFGLSMIAHDGLLALLALCLAAGTFGVIAYSFL